MFNLSIVTCVAAKGFPDISDFIRLSSFPIKTAVTTVDKYTQSWLSWILPPRMKLNFKFFFLFLSGGRRFCNFVSIGGKFLNFLSEDAARGELNRKLAAHWIFSKLVWINPS